MKLRSNEEIEAQIKKGEAFVEEHPYSMFGDNNKEGFKIFKKIVDLAREGKTYDEIEGYIDDFLEDEEYTNADSTLQWIFGESDEEIY